MLSALQLHWFWTEHFYICHIHCPEYAYLENWIKVSLNINLDFMWIFSYPTTLNSLLSHKMLCVYMFYWQSHLEFQHYCASYQRCILGWKELREVIQVIVWGVKRSCIIRSIHQNGGVVITGATSSRSPTPPTVTNHRWLHQGWNTHRRTQKYTQTHTEREGNWWGKKS